MQEETLERQYVFRHYASSEDLPHLSDLLTAVQAHDQDGEDPSEAVLRGQLAWPHYDPEQDCWVIAAPGSSHELIGYSSVFAQTPMRSTSIWLSIRHGGGEDWGEHYWPKLLSEQERREPGG